LEIRWRPGHGSLRRLRIGASARPGLIRLEDRLVPSVTVSVDAAANLHPINPNVYGVAYGTTSQLADLNVPLNRYGGNNASRYNWQLNADNRGSDWYFESIPDASSVPGERGDTFLANSRAGGADAILSVPTIDWVANVGSNRSKLASFSIAKYGPQTGHDPYWADAGNGTKSGNQYVTGNDPSDANVPSDPSFQQAWIQHLVDTWGTAGNGGVDYYALDNEPSIWFATHRDVHPVGPTMVEILNRTIAYASMIKAIDPAALVLGPEEWGWSGYFYSGYDQQYGSQHGWGYLPDRAAHGGQDYLPYLLDQLHQYDLATGQRLLDVFTVHYYPQGGEFSNDVSTAMQLLRNRSTRSLWDPTYRDASWINDYVQLIPRLQNWVNTYYPGTQIGLTEYNWGAEGHINGATTQADILGIFGREGLDLATRWTTPAADTPTYKAIKMYRNYDGNDSTFGDVSVSAAVPNPDDLSAFASLRSADGALTTMVINKDLTTANDVTVNLANFAGAGTVQVWQLTAANAITQLSDIAYSGASFATTVPAQSITLFVVPSGSLVASRSTVAATASVFGSVHSLAAGPGAAVGSSARESWTPEHPNPAAGEPAPPTEPGADDFAYVPCAGKNLQAKQEGRISSLFGRILPSPLEGEDCLSVPDSGSI
jgi:hypothetical protein